MLQVNYIFNTMQIILFTFVTVYLVNSLGGRIVGVHPFFVSRFSFPLELLKKKKGLSQKS